MSGVHEACSVGFGELAPKSDLVGKTEAEVGSGVGQEISLSAALELFVAN